MTTRRLVFAGFVLGVAASVATAQPASDRIEMACGAASRVALPEARTPVELVVVGEGVLTIEEHGQDVAAKGGDIVEVATPPRHGTFFVAVTSGTSVAVARAWPSAARGEIVAVLACGPLPAGGGLRDWARKVQALEREIALPSTAETYDRLAPQLEAIGREAPTSYAQALAVHLRAQVLLAAGRSADAALVFHRAQTEWMKIGDRERALAALVAEAEDLQRSGDHQKVLTVARSLGPEPDGRHYFGVRLENSRCLGLQYLGKLEQSAACYRWTMQALDRLGETLERISTQQDYAQLEADRGELDRATHLGDGAFADISDKRWDSVAGPDIPVVRGRVQRLLSDLAVQRGDVAAGLRHSQQALVEFEKAHHVRWQANTLLRIAVIYNQLGAYADALDATDIALQRLSVRDAPARVASATWTKAQIELARGHIAQAAEQAAAAQAIYDSLHMSIGVSVTRLTLAEAMIAMGDFAAARAIVDTIRDIAPSLAGRLELVRAELSVGDREGANLPALDANRPRPLAEWLRAQAVVAGRLNAGGQHDAALRHLERAASYLADLADRTGNPVVQKAMERKRRVLLSAALPLILSLPPDRQAEAAWRWVVLTDLARDAAAATPNTATTGEFDRALAESLMRSNSVDGDRTSEVRLRLQEHLLGAVTASFAPAPATPKATIPQLAAFRDSLPHDTVFVALLPAGNRLAELIVSAADARLVVRGSVAALQDSSVQLVQHVIDYADLASVEVEVQALSGELLGALDGAVVPKRLLVDAPEPFDGLPWPLLYWPGSTSPLVETTAISLVAPAEHYMPRADGKPHLVLFGGEPGNATDNDELPVLASVAGELAVIARERARFDWQTSTTQSPNRDAVLQALATPHGWVHLATHGSSSTEYLGRSGVWLRGAGSSASSELLSWMDVVEHGVRADVVILNACALAAAPQTSLSAATSFADAVLRAGAGDVVAALWPINDTAAYLWAANFYAHLPAVPASNDIAEAVRQSMLRLRDTRTYRHPKHWASLAHLTRMPLPLATVSPARR